MPERNRIDRELERQAKLLKPEPIQWDQVERRVRRRRRWAVLFAVLLTLGLTILLAGILLAGRTALDPTYSPPIFSRSAISGEIQLPSSGRQLVQDADGEAIPPATLATRAASRGAGYLLRATVHATDLGNQRLATHWVLRPAGTGGTPRAHAPSTIFTLRSSDEEHDLASVVPAPVHDGNYVAELRLSDGAAVIGRLKTPPFYAIGDFCCHLYRTPTYEAPIPRDWRVQSSYSNASPGRYVTDLVKSPTMEIVIDTTLHEHGDPINDEHSLEGILENGSERYERVALRRFRVAGAPVEEWSYWSGSDIYTNELFYRGHEGYAVLGRSSAAHFHEVRDLCRMIVGSLKSH